jgi:hypothetical protein
MAQSVKKPPIFDVIDIEREIEEEFRKLPVNRESQPPISRRLPSSAPELSMPDYVEHRAGPRRSASCRRKRLSANMKLRRRTSRTWA